MKQFIICPKCGAIILSDCNYDPIPCECGEIDEAGLWKPAKAISIKQPWSYLICSGIKDIENRTWKLPEKYKGQRILVHASVKPWTWNAVVNYLTSATKSVFEMFGFNADWLSKLQTSAIIGSVEIVDCVINHESVWAEKSKQGYYWENYRRIQDKPIYNWVLANPILFEKPIPCKGKLSFFIPEIA